VPDVDLDDLRELLRNRRDYGWMAPKFVPVGADDGRVVVQVDVTIDHVNVAKNLHGGAGATLVDVVGSLAVIGADKWHRYGVSTDLNVSWFAPVPLGETAEVEARVLKIGRTMAFVEVTIRRASDNVLCLQGRLTKSLGDPPAPA
jgi:acyl-coenzyme A thioesterase 13